MSLVRNEQIKLAATAMNGIGVGAIVTGGFGPAAAFLIGLVQNDDVIRVAALFVVWTGSAGVLFGRAQVTLRGLNDPGD